MAGSVPFLLFFAFLFGTTLLVLVAAYQSRADQRARQQAEEAAPGIPTGVDGLFSPLAAPPRRRTAPGVRLNDLECHLRTQRQVAAAFVSDPCFETLFERPRASMDARVSALQRRLGRERGVVSRFAEHPSLERLFPALSKAQTPAELLS